MKHYVNLSVACLAACLCLSASAQNYQKKLKNAKAITVEYQTSYKGNVRPGGVLMTVSGDQVSLENVMPADAPQPEAGQLSTANYVDYSVKKAYKRAELPNGKVI